MKNRVAITAVVLVALLNPLLAVKTLVAGHALIIILAPSRRP